jgi:transcription-repair coupling factor (superfamily II helicase)
MNILDYINRQPEIQAWHSKLNTLSRTLLTGVSGSLKSGVIAGLYQDNPDKYVVVTDTQYTARTLYDELTDLVDDTHVFHYFSDDNLYTEFAIASKDRLSYRIQALNFLVNPDSQGIILIPSFALQQLLPDPMQYKQSVMTIDLGTEYILTDFVNQLSTMGYTKVQRVMSPGEFANRGDIIDIYPIDSENAIRLEFFGDEVDSIRQFDVDSQKSKETEEQVVITPATEMLFTEEDYLRADKALASVKTDNEKLASYIEELHAAVRNRYRHDDFRKISHFFFNKHFTLFDYFPKNVHLVLDDYKKITDAQDKFDSEVIEFTKSEALADRYIDGLVYAEDNSAKLRNYKPVTFMSNFQRGLGNLRFTALYEIKQHSMQQYFNQFDLLASELGRYVKNEFTVVVSVSEDKQEAVLKQFRDHKIDVVITSPDQLQDKTVNFSFTHLRTGFVLMEEKLALITEHELIGRTFKKKVQRQNISNAERLKDYNELEIGDYVVHRSHGVGKYLGIRTLEIGGLHKDYITLQYANGDSLSVPIEHVDYLTKYTGGTEGKLPKINKLNDGRWKRTLTHVQKEVEDISKDLIKLYAERQKQKGFAFSKDDDEQRLFDHNFAYVETDDQLRSIDEVKADMEKSRPMDRLLVGDVGFGKTEVAMRAAFKAVNDHKQVAVLVPTTVLAEQHYNNFLDRFSEFGVEIGVLSRFQTKKQQVAILDKLKKGRLDIIIGTHRLLSNDVEFADLGLLVIDEEQRFGVKHKEKIKSLKSKVDVLTLTATPIPRTLHMSMLGIRDLSVIETPPTNRYPVQTYVIETHAGVIRDAVLREMSRGGQVFYLYNRVDTIEQKVSQLQELIPEARIGFAHGQMSEVQLENTLLDFVNGEYDVLVSTTIIETGVDIPNANTLFVENADYMGLSTLYQLRGRVGRSNRVAYAYFMYQPDKSLNDQAEKRLDTIKGFTELGAGFKIAMRDLSIRGAGNLLGAEQSGFIDSVGFELYNQLLENEVNKQLGRDAGQTKFKTDTHIGLEVEAFIPDDYISDQRQKIEIYKRVKQLDSRRAYEDLQSELIDRFGDYPVAVGNLLDIGLLKFFSDEALLDAIRFDRLGTTIVMSKEANRFYLAQDYFEALEVSSLKARMSEEVGQMTVRFDTRRVEMAKILSEVMHYVEKLWQIKSNKK